MDEKLKKKVYDTIKSIMNIDIESMNLSTKINTISEWDSFNNLMLISQFQNDLNVEFDIEDIENVNTLQDLFDLINKMVK